MSIFGLGIGAALGIALEVIGMIGTGAKLRQTLHEWWEGDEDPNPKGRTVTSGRRKTKTMEA